jgi:DnaJ-class molecular chaperone
MTSLYETLEVSPHASTIVIWAAWLSLAQHYHPDKNLDVKDAGQRLMHINHAYAVLSDR